MSFEVRFPVRFGGVKTPPLWCFYGGMLDTPRTIRVKRAPYFVTMDWIIVCVCPVHLAMKKEWS